MRGPSNTPGTVSGYRMIELFEISGKRIRTIAEGEVNPGTHETIIDVNDLEDGIYILRLQLGDEVVNSKLVVVRE